MSRSGGQNGFLSLLGWPNRTDSDFLGVGSQHKFSCPDGQVPIGAGARSSCFQLSDFKVSASHSKTSLMQHPNLSASYLTNFARCL